MQCYKCKNYGHIKKDYPRLRGQNDDKKNEDSSKSANVVQNDDSDFGDGDMLVISTNQYVDVWFLNSTASYHMTPDKKWFTSYRSGSFGCVYLGDDKPCVITGIRTIKIQLHDGVVRTLNDVRHIPDMRKNLIFLGTLHANSFNYRSDNDKEILRVTKGLLIVMKRKQTTKIFINC